MILSSLPIFLDKLQIAI
jgi:transcriptional regulator with XRE-family HTH domain